MSQQEEAEVCAVCFEALGEQNLLVLKCQHRFHCVCVADWLVEHATCPSCRKLHGGERARLSGDAVAWLKMVGCTEMFITLYLFAHVLQLWFSLFNFGVYVKGISRLDQQLSDSLVVGLQFAAMCLSLPIVLFLQMTPGFMFTRRHGDEVENMARRLRHSHYGILFCVAFDAVALTYILLRPHLSLEYYAVYFPMALIKAEILWRVIFDVSLTQLEWKVYIVIALACVTMGGGAT